MKLNCDITPRKGHITIGLSRACDVVWDTAHGFPYDDSSVETVRLAHLPDDAIFLLSDAWRVLRPGGILAIDAPVGPSWDPDTLLRFCLDDRRAVHSIRAKFRVERLEDHQGSGEHRVRAWLTAEKGRRHHKDLLSRVAGPILYVRSSDEGIGSPKGVLGIRHGVCGDGCLQLHVTGLTHDGKESLRKRAKELRRAARKGLDALGKLGLGRFGSHFDFRLLQDGRSGWQGGEVRRGIGVWSLAEPSPVLFKAVETRHPGPVILVGQREWMDRGREPWIAGGSLLVLIASFRWVAESVQGAEAHDLTVRGAKDATINGVWRFRYLDGWTLRVTKD